MGNFGASVNGGVVDFIADGGVPRSISGRARTVISGGQFVTVSGAANVVGSTAALYNTGSVIFGLLVDSNYVVGMALHNVGSNEMLGVATRGLFIATSADVISGGVAVIPFSGTVQGVKAQSISISYSGTTIGRAITASVSGTNAFTLVNFAF